MKIRFPEEGSSGMLHKVTCSKQADLYYIKRCVINFHVYRVHAHYIVIQSTQVKSCIKPSGVAIHLLMHLCVSVYASIETM